MAYTGNPSTNTSDALRLLIGDTSTSTSAEIFSNTEIAYFVAQKPNVFLQAEMALTAVIGTTRGTDLSAITRKQVGDLSIEYGAAGGDAGSSLSGRAKAFRLLGIRNVSPYTGGISVADKDVAENDADANRPVFQTGQFGNEAYTADGSTGSGYW